MADRGSRRLGRGLVTMTPQPTQPGQGQADPLVCEACGCTPGDCECGDHDGPKPQFIPVSEARRRAQPGQEGQECFVCGKRLDPFTEPHLHEGDRVRHPDCSPQQDTDEG
jgi:hypothetical protein